MNMLRVIEKSKIWFSISILVIAIGMISLVVNGLNYGIDFKGGTLISIEIGKTFDKEKEIDPIIQKYDKDAVTNIANETQIEIRGNNITEEQASDLFNEVKEKFNLEDTALLSQSKVGPSIGKELKQKAVKSLLIATLAMLIYIGIRFEFTFGVAAIVALLHDVLITLSVYAIFKVPINSPFIAAMLAILGYSINDTIVIFDRIRENRRKMRGKSINDLTNLSVTQTLTRSINTVVTTLFTIAAVYIFVPAIREFSFPLIVGILSGAYSSIFIASPVWVLMKKRTKKANA